MPGQAVVVPGRKRHRQLKWTKGWHLPNLNNRADCRVVAIVDPEPIDVSDDVEIDLDDTSKPSKGDVKS